MIFIVFNSEVFYYISIYIIASLIIKLSNYVEEDED